VQALTRPVLTRSVSLPSAVFVVIGYVVGASIYILPGTLAPDTGPAVFIAYALAAVPAIVAGFVMAQIGAALPVSGSIFVLLRDALAPYAGFMYQWIMLAMAAVVVPLVAFGFADYLGYFIPGLNARAVAAALAVAFIAVNLLGMTIATIAQNVMVVLFLVALTVFGIGGAAAGDVANLEPLFPKGYAVLSIAAITAYFSYAGVFVIAEIAGEIRDPARNIPRAVLLAFVVIIALYVLVPLALAMVIPWPAIGDTPIAVVTASQYFLPAPLVTFVAISALFAAATTVNSILMGLSRDFFQGANSGLFPAWFSVVGRRTGAPNRAILLVGGLSLAGIAIGGGITSYAQLALIGLMIIQVMTGLALLRLPARLPEAYRASSFRLSIPVLRLVAVSYIAFSLLFLYILASERSTLLLIGLAFLLAGVVYEKAWSRSGRGRAYG
jgi:basic amino acid/polyamine antiporter, APA family